LAQTKEPKLLGILQSLIYQVQVNIQFLHTSSYGRMD